jgi:hypothetical protein
MFTRKEFEQKLAVRKQLERQEGRLLAAVSVGLGIAQLFFIHWIEKRIERGLAVELEGTVFLAYMTLVGWLFWRMLRRVRASRLTCPHCRVVLQDMSERVATATGNCDSCGYQIVERVEASKGA